MSDASPHLRGILDTSTVILLERLADASTLPAEPLITAVTLAELSVGPLVAHGESERVARQSQLQQAEADFEPLAAPGAPQPTAREPARDRENPQQRS